MASRFTEEIRKFGLFQQACQVRLPPPPPLLLRKSEDSPLISRRLHYVSTAFGGSWTVQQPNRRVERCRTQVHIPLRGHQVLVPRQLLNRLCRCPLHRRCEQNVCLRMWTPGFTFVLRATRRITTCTSFCESGCPCLSQRTRAPFRCRASFKASVSRLVSGRCLNRGPVARYRASLRRRAIFRPFFKPTR